MYSTVQSLKLSIRNEKEITKNELVSEANVIWKKVTAELTNKMITEELTEELLGKIRAEHPEFCKSYPIVLRYMVNMEYEASCFKKYLSKIEKYPWKSTNEYLDSQTDYVVMLYKTKHPHYDEKFIRNLKMTTRKMLQQEHDTFVKISEKYTNEVEKEDKLYKCKNKNLIKDFCIVNQNDIAQVCQINAVPITCQSDISLDNIVNLDKILENL